jgi:hypothetical protein
MAIYSDSVDKQRQLNAACSPLLSDPRAVATNSTSQSTAPQPRRDATWTPCPRSSSP